MTPAFVDADMIAPTDSHDRIATAERAEPTASTEPNDPIEPIEQAEPTLPIDNTEFFDPIDKTEPVDHRDRTERCIDTPFDQGTGRPDQRLAVWRRGVTNSWEVAFTLWQSET